MGQIDPKAQHAKRLAAAAAKATGAAPTPAVKADRPKLAEGQQRSRGRTILSANGGCTFGTKCGNPGRWPVARDPKIAKVAGVTAGTLTCTNHLRALASRTGQIEQIRELEARLLGAAAKTPRKARAATRAAKATVEVTPTEA